MICVCAEQLLARVATDKEEKVRLTVVQAIIEAALEQPNMVDPKLYETLIEHMRDKKPSVRREAMEGLSHLFKKFCAEYWKKGDALPAEGKRVSSAPRKILAMYSPQNQWIVETLLDEGRFETTCYLD